MASAVPAQPLQIGVRSKTTSHRAEPPAILAARAQRPLTTDFGRPMIVTKPWLGTADAAATSPIVRARLRPSSNEMTPATQRAVYTPIPNPVTARKLSASSLSWRWSFSKAARPAMKRAGWLYRGSASLAPGPLRQISKMLQPRMLLAFASILTTPGKLRQSDSISTYSDPQPGKRRPALAPTLLAVTWQPPWARNDNGSASAGFDDGASLPSEVSEQALSATVGGDVVQARAALKVACKASMISNKAWMSPVVHPSSSFSLLRRASPMHCACCKCWFCTLSWLLPVQRAGFMHWADNRLSGTKDTSVTVCRAAIEGVSTDTGVCVSEFS
mmetsp:Transcript_77419/g.214051  ORF Transcript_77419/g.214051 Transcript_77419/m.214051 type:complete len:330 (+) Transcript_77419:451-1440(+)